MPSKSSSDWIQKIRKLVKAKIQLRKWKVNRLNEHVLTTRLQTNSYIAIVEFYTWFSLWFLHTHTDRHTHSHTHSVHLLLVNQFGGIHKVLAIKQNDGSCNGTSCPPEHHICQSLRPRIAWKTKNDCSNSRKQLKLLRLHVIYVLPSCPTPFSSSFTHLSISRKAPLYEPGPTPRFFLLKGVFYLPLLLVGG